jgi:Asp-tRNA(Asn)/Glu-tRNA(Gln) amidotransferase A subunit family amidase
VFDGLAELVQRISDYVAGAGPIHAVRYPASVSAYLDAADQPEIRSCNAGLRAAYEALDSASADELIEKYRAGGALGPHWGVPYHYQCFQRLG